MDNNTSIFTAMLKSLKMIHAALIGSCVLYILAGIYFVKHNFDVKDNAAVHDQKLMFISIVMLLALIPLAYYISKKMVERIPKDLNLNDKLVKYRQSFIIKLALIEFACLLNITFYIISGNIYILYQVIIIIIALILSSPNKTAIVDELNLTKEEIEEI
jgi:hypothetical protein